MRPEPDGVSILGTDPEEGKLTMDSDVKNGISSFLSKEYIFARNYLSTFNAKDAGSSKAGWCSA